MPLSDTAIRSAKPGVNPVTLAERYGFLRLGSGITSELSSATLNRNPALAGGASILQRNGGNLQASIRGELVDIDRATAQPQGTIGQFQIRGIDATYQANGTFAGDIRR